MIDIKQTIYVDILVFMNTIINIYVLIITGLLSHSRINRYRIISGSLVGGLLACTVLLPPMNAFLSLFLKIFGSSLIVFVSFENSGVDKYIRKLVSFVFVNCIFAGAVILFGFTFDTPLVYYNNANFYFDLSAPYLILISSLTYILLKITLKRTSKNSNEKCFYEIEISREKSVARCRCLSDTGSSLRDVFSDTPIIIVESGVIRNVICDELLMFLNDGFSGITEENKAEIRLIPYKSISGGGYLKAIKCDTIRIIGNDNSCYEIKNGYIAVYNGKLSKGEYRAVLNPEIFDVAREVA